MHLDVEILAAAWTLDVDTRRERQQETEVLSREGPPGAGRVDRLEDSRRKPTCTDPTRGLIPQA